MAKIPILSRLSLADYIGFIHTGMALLLESILRFIVALFPTSWVDHLRYQCSSSWFPRILNGYKNAEDEPSADLPPVAMMKHIRDMIEHLYVMQPSIRAENRSQPDASLMPHFFIFV
jgi:hypothetical protein